MMKKVLLRILIISLSLMFVSTICYSAETESVGKLAQSDSASLVNINNADIEQLKTLPGITDYYAKKIIDGRPYKYKEDLRTRKIIPAGVYEKIKNRIFTKELS